MNSFPQQDFPPDYSLTSDQFPYSCQIHWHLQIIQKSGNPAKIPDINKQFDYAMMHSITYSHHKLRLSKNI